MRHFYVITNEQKDPYRIVTNRLCASLREKGCYVSTQEERHSDKEGYTDVSRIPQEVEAVIVLGGDGTMLQAARDTGDRNLALIGVNLGTLGYLTEIEQDSMEEALERIVRDDYQLEERMMLHGEIVGENACANDALNDIVISRKGSLQVVHYSIYVNGKLLREYSADGVIIATPTGSTGYNLSAGGPIVEPKAKMIVITPICPHTTNTRSIILSPEDEVMIEIEPGRDGKPQALEAYFDGSFHVGIHTGDQIYIRRSRRQKKFIRLDQESFLQVLHTKMNE